MSSLQSRIIRLSVATNGVGAPIAEDGSIPRFWAGSPSKLQLAFRDEDGALITDFSTLSGVTAQIKALLNGGPPAPTDAYYVEKGTAAFNPTLTEEQWADGSACHAEILLTADDLNLAAANYWLVIVGIAAAPVTYAAGQIRLLQDGYGTGAATPPAATPPWTRTEAELRYLAKSGLVDGNVPVIEDGQAADSGKSAVSLLTAAAAIPADEILAGVDGSRKAKSTGKKISDIVLKTGTQDMTGAVLLVASESTTADSNRAVNVVTLRAYAPKKAVNPLLALTGEAPDGADVRFRTEGGVYCTPAPDGVPASGCVTSVSGDFVFAALLEPEQTPGEPSSTLPVLSTNNLRRLGLNASASEPNWRIIFIADGPPAWLIDTGIPKTVTRPMALVFRRVSGVMSASLDGGPFTAFPNNISGNAPVVDTSDIVRVLGIQYPGYNRFGGSVRRMVWLNDTTTTAAEAFAVAWGKTPPRLAHPVIPFPASGVWTKSAGIGSGTASGASATGFTYSGNTGDVAYIQLAHSVALPGGQKVRVSFTASNAGASAYVEDGSGGLVPVVSGANTLLLTVGNAGDRSTITFQVVADIVISNFTATPLGTVDAFDPHRVSADASWLGRHGAILRATPGSGFSAIAGRPQSRELTLTLPATEIDGVANESELFEADIVLTAAGDEVAKLAGIKAGDTVSLRSNTALPSGMMFKQGPRVVADGTVVQGVMNFNGSDENTGSLTVRLTHHVR